MTSSVINAKKDALQQLPMEELIEMFRIQEEGKILKQYNVIKILID